MMDLFNNLDALQRTFWFIAIPASLVFIIQMIMTFMGADSSDGLEADFDSDLNGSDDTFQLFSLRNLINFLLGFSWTGLSFYQSIENKTLLIIISLLVGLMFVFLFFLIIKQVKKLAEDNSFHIQHTMGKSGEVYLTIPEKKSGKGKILISINGSTRELDAMTLNEKIPYGALVKVVGTDHNILIVEPI